MLLKYSRQKIGQQHHIYWGSEEKTKPTCSNFHPSDMVETIWVSSSSWHCNTRYTCFTGPCINNILNYKSLYEAAQVLETSFNGIVHPQKNYLLALMSFQIFMTLWQYRIDIEQNVFFSVQCKHALKMTVFFMQMLKLCLEVCAWSHWRLGRCTS